MILLGELASLSVFGLEGLKDHKPEKFMNMYFAGLLLDYQRFLVSQLRFGD